MVLHTCPVTFIGIRLSATLIKQWLCSWCVTAVSLWEEYKWHNFFCPLTQASSLYVQQEALNSHHHGCMIWEAETETEDAHTRLLTFSFESRKDKDEIVVKVRELVELFKFLKWQLRIISLSNHPFSLSQVRLRVKGLLIDYSFMLITQMWCVYFWSKIYCKWRKVDSINALSP